MRTVNETLKTKKSHRKMGLPQWSGIKESACNAGDTSLIPGLGRSPGGGNENPLQYSCLKNSRDRGTWPVTKSQIQLSE